MRAPVLVPIHAAHPSIREALPALPEREGVDLFVVVAEGAFAGQRWEVGEILVCRGEARSGDAVVLVARGHGRPRLGSVEGTRFLGDGGEPCHPARWRAAGRIVATYRQRELGWVVDLQQGPAAAGRAGEALPVAGRAPATPAAQLSLFAA
jgi:hypothetical protein